ncbi:MAG: DNA-binding protein [Lachnospiraceae bacterium]|nr:DNA-binding protein [Lachnospiraceae bacterium]
MNGYLKISEVSKKWGIKERRINTLCLDGRIEGVIKFGNTWAIPEDAKKPKDERVKSGKYVKKPNADET